MKAKWNNKYYKITTLPTLTKSSREVSFPEIEIDFTDHEIEDLPIKFQEIEIVDTTKEPEETKFFGYCENFQFPEMDGTEKKILVNIGLMSPLKLAGIKSKTIQVQYKPLNEVVVDVLSPLINEGFVIEQNTLPTIKVALREAFKPVEQIMNQLSNDYNFYWFIDEKKKIYIKNGGTLQTAEPVVNSLTEINAFAGYTYRPTMNAVEHANIINAKNQNILQFNNELIPQNIELADQDEIQFRYPVSISKTTGSRIANESDRATFGFPLWMMVINRTVPAGLAQYFIQYDEENDEVLIDSAIGFDGVDNADVTKTILLKTDPVDRTKIVGLKNVWGGTIELQSVGSYSTIVPTITIYQDAIDIEKSKEKVSPSGKIEKTVDFNGRYITKTDSLDFAKNRVLRTSSPALVDEIEITIKGVPNEEYDNFIDQAIPLKTIVTNEQYAKGRFIITDTSLVQEPNWNIFQIKAKNTNIIDNYLDLFRSDKGEAEEDELTNQIYSFLVRDDEIVEKRLTIVDGGVIDESGE